MKSRVTIILTSYNQWDYLVEAMESILMVEIDYFHLIIIDDGSKLSEFKYNEVESIFNVDLQKLEKLKIIRNIKNLGLVKSINLALKNVLTEYVYILDGDDLIPKNALKNMVDYNKIHEFDILGGLTSLISNKELPVKSYENISDRLKIRGFELFLDIVNGKLPFRFSGSLIKLSALEKIGYLDEKFYLYADRPTILTLALNDFAFGVVDEITCFYRENVGISNKKSASNLIWLDDQIKIFDSIYFKHIKHLDSIWVINTSEKLKFIMGFRQVKSNPFKIVLYFWSNRLFILKNLDFKSLMNFFSREVAN